MTKATMKKITVTRAIAPEDIRAGLYVMPIHRLVQLPIMRCEAVEPSVEILQVVVRPFWNDLPGKVVGVCLPFVVVEMPDSKTEILDTRSVRLAQVNKRFAKIARKPHEPEKDKKSARSKSKKKRK